MGNSYENWDEYDWEEHNREMAHKRFLSTPKGKQWQKEQKREQFNENLKNFIIIAIIVIILLLGLIGGYHGSNEPYRR